MISLNKLYFTFY